MPSDGSDRIELLWGNREDGPRTILGEHPTPSPSVVPTRPFNLEDIDVSPTPPSLTGSQTTESIVSSVDTPPQSDIFSQISAPVSDVTSVMAPHPDATQLAPAGLIPSQADNGYGTEDDVGFDFPLPCQFLFINCLVQFHPLDWRAWINHTLEHFRTGNVLSLPLVTICPYCDIVEFRASRQDSPEDTWRRRMFHIYGHFQQGVFPKSSRPDYRLMKHMHSNGLMTSDEYKRMTRYTERPHCPGLVADDFVLPEKARREERAGRVYDNIRAEDRERRRRRRHG